LAVGNSEDYSRELLSTRNIDNLETEDFSHSKNVFHQNVIVCVGKMFIKNKICTKRKVHRLECTTVAPGKRRPRVNYLNVPLQLPVSSATSAMSVQLLRRRSVTLLQGLLVPLL